MVHASALVPRNLWGVVHANLEVLHGADRFHRAQGSQFKRVIVPIRKSRLPDQTLIYTAVTRGVDQVVLLGNLEATNAAIKAPATAARRIVMLPTLLTKRLE